MFFKIKRNTKLSKLQVAYANKVGKDVSTIRYVLALVKRLPYFECSWGSPHWLLSCRFLYDGERITEEDTPSSLEMEDNGSFILSIVYFVAVIIDTANIDTIDVMVERKCPPLYSPENDSRTEFFAIIQRWAGQLEDDVPTNATLFPLLCVPFSILPLSSVVYLLLNTVPFKPFSFPSAAIEKCNVWWRICGFRTQGYQRCCTMKVFQLMPGVNCRSEGLCNIDISGKQDACRC